MLNMNIVPDTHLVLALTTVVSNVVLGFLVYSSNPKKHTNRMYLIFNLALCVWVWFESMANMTFLSTDLMKLGLRIDFVFAPITAYIFYVFADDFPVKKSGRGLAAKRLVLLIVALMFSLTSYFTDLIIADLGVNQMGTVQTSGLLDPLYSVYIFVLLMLGLWSLYKRVRSADEGHIKTQAQYMLIASIFPVVTVSVALLILWRVFNPSDPQNRLVVDTLPSIARTSTLVLTYTTAYAIVKHRLFGIRIVLGRLVFWFGVAAFLFFAFYGVITLENNVFGSVTSPEMIVLNLVLAFMLAMLFSYYEKQLRDFVERYVVRYGFDVDEVVRRFNEDVLENSGTENIVSTLFATINKILSPEKQGFFVAQTGQGGDVVESSYQNFSSEDVQLLEENELINNFFDLTDSIKVVGIDSVGNDVQLLTLMKALDVDAVIPANREGLSAVYFIGTKKNGQKYSEKELSLVQELVYYSCLVVERRDW